MSCAVVISHSAFPDAPACLLPQNLRLLKTTFESVVKGYKKSPESWDCWLSGHCLLVPTEAEPDVDKERTRPPGAASKPTQWRQGPSSPMNLSSSHGSILPLLQVKQPLVPGACGTTVVAHEGYSSIMLKLCAVQGNGHVLVTSDGVQDPTALFSRHSAMRHKGGAPEAPHRSQPSALPCLISQTDGMLHLQMLHCIERIC